MEDSNFRDSSFEVHRFSSFDLCKMPKGNRYGVKSRVRKTFQRKPRFKGSVDKQKQPETRDLGQDQSETTIDLQNRPTITNQSTTPAKLLEMRLRRQKLLHLLGKFMLHLKHQSRESTPISHTSSSHCDADQEGEGYRLVYVENMRKAMEEMHQFSCSRSKITVTEGSRRSGLSSMLQLAVAAAGRTEKE